MAARIGGDRRLVLALALQSVLVAVLAAALVVVVVGEHRAMRAYGDTPPTGGYGTILAALGLLVLAVPAVLTAIGWLVRHRAGAVAGSAVPTALGALALAVVLSPFGSLLGWGPVGLLVPVVPCLALAGLALSGLRSEGR